MRRIATVSVLVAPLLAPGVARAQGTERVPDLSRRPYVAGALAPGTRVRATIRHGIAGARPRRERVTGRLIRLGPDSLLLEASDRLIAIPRSGLSRLQMPDRVPPLATRAWRGARTGAVVGAIGGAVVGYLAWDGCRGELVCMSRTDQAMASGIVAGALGFVVGGTVGAARGGARWRDVRIDADTRVGLVAEPRGVGVTLRF